MRRDSRHFTEQITGSQKMTNATANQYRNSPMRPSAPESTPEPPIPQEETP